MITDLNRFIAAQNTLLKQAKDKAEDLVPDYLYYNGYYQAMEDMRQLALDIYHGRNGY